MKTHRVLRLCCAVSLAATLWPSMGLAQESVPEPVAPAPAAEEPPPLPVHTIEGVGGGGITPMAYLVNPGEDCVFGTPAFSISYVNLGRKNLDAIAVTETLFKRIELGYAANRFGLGTLPMDIRDATGVDIDENDVWLHHFNVRALLVEENTCFGGIALPAVTAGVHFKYNEGIDDVDQRLGGALSGIGYDRPSGEDFTFTATKTFAQGFGRPLIATAGLRLSEAANLGYLGFSDDYRASFEGSIAYLLTNRILLAYEFRQKSSPYGEIRRLVRRGSKHSTAPDPASAHSRARSRGGHQRRLPRA